MKPTNLLYAYRPKQFNHWQKNGRKPIDPVMRIGIARATRPLELRDFVSGKPNVASDVVCISQMMDLMSCLKSADFDQSLCDKQIEAFSLCYKNYITQMNISKNQKDMSIPTPGATKLSTDQLNTLLKRWPQQK